MWSAAADVPLVAEQAAQVHRQRVVRPVAALGVVQQGLELGPARGVVADRQEQLSDAVPDVECAAGVGGDRSAAPASPSCWRHWATS